MKKIVEETLKIDGMTCVSCEKTIDESLKKLMGIKKVIVSLTNRSVIVKYESDKLKREDIISAIERKGYKVVNGRNTTYIITLVILVLAYILAKNTNLFNYIPNVDETMTYSILFVVGLLTSLHCIAMCGGINMSVCMSSKNDNKFVPGLLYNSGRVSSYTIIGGVVGGIGSIITLSPNHSNMVSIIAGLFMIILGINMFGLFRRINLNIKMPRFFRQFINKNRKKYSSPYMIGLLNGFMPCGPLQTMQLYALGTGSVISGALSMLAFSLGTVPLMLAVSFMSGLLSGKIGVSFKKISAILIVILGLVMFNRGFDINAITKFNPDALRYKDVTFAVIKGDYQEVQTGFTRGQYQAIVVQKGIPVKWTITAKGGDINGCNNEMVIPVYEITKALEFGDNFIEFYPDKVGSFKYYCWMYMISSDIYVVDDLSAF